MTTWVFPLAGQSNMVSRADADGSSPWPARVRFVTQEGRPFAPAAVIGSADGKLGRFSSRNASPRTSSRRGPATASFSSPAWSADQLLEPPLEPRRRPLRQPRGADGHRPRRASRLAPARHAVPGLRDRREERLLATTFRRALDRFVRGIRADLRAPELPIVFGELPPAFVDGHPDRAAIRDELQRATLRLPYTAVVPSRSPSAADDAACTFPRRACSLIGGRYAAALAAAEANALVPAIRVALALGCELGNAAMTLARRGPPCEITAVNPGSL